MAREEYQDRLDGLRKDVVGMSDLVVGRLRTALEALEEKDEGEARAVLEGDDEVNARYLEIENECVDLIALQQPVAGDLRLVAASFKIITDLERVGDLATNIAGYALEAERSRFSEIDVQEIGAFAASMVEDAVRAYEEEDTEACRGVAESDEILDARCEGASERVFRGLVGGGYEDEEDETEAVVQDATRLLLTIRDLERVGDHGVNVAGRTLYMIENDDELIW
ncbi:MAG: phosphate signaling complex protein PhoU [Halobacteriales archaeon]|nr:phosphate signaling complex protein PhoU [Halobacteriales archaeon]